jgi:foldase protein PrsA
MRKVFPLLLLIALINVSCTQSEKKEETKKDATKAEVTTTDKQDNSTGKKVVARVNGKPIYEEDLKGRPLRMVINEEILYQEGLKQGLDKRFQGEIDDYKKRVIAETVKRELLSELPKAKEIEVTEEQIKNYYEKHPDKYTFISVKEISLPDKTTAEEVRKRLLAGEDPAKIKSELGEKVVVKDLKFGKMHYKKFDKIEVGAISEIIEDGGQFKILQITDVRQVPLQKVSNAIKQRIIARKTGKMIQEKVDEMKKENNIKVEIIAEQEEIIEEDESE